MFSFGQLCWCPIRTGWEVELRRVYQAGDAGNVAAEINGSGPWNRRRPWLASPWVPETNVSDHLGCGFFSCLISDFCHLFWFVCLLKYNGTGGSTMISYDFPSSLLFSATISHFFRFHIQAFGWSSSKVDAFMVRLTKMCPRKALTCSVASIVAVPKPPKPWRRQQLSPQWDQDFFIALLCFAFAMLQTIQFYDLTAYPRDFQSI